MKVQRLHHIIAIEKEAKGKALSKLTELHRKNGNPAGFNGFQKTYETLNETGEHLPPEQQVVQSNAMSMLQEAKKVLQELFDVIATKDYANCSAKADVKVGDLILLTSVPATYLLFLEKNLRDIRTFVEGIPVLDPAFEWELDTSSGLYKSKPVNTLRTKKVQKPIVLYPATDKHPAQTQLITEDETVGQYVQTRTSSCLPAPVKAQYLKKIDDLSVAVKQAREDANMTEAPGQTAYTVLQYIFGP